MILYSDILEWVKNENTSKVDIALQACIIKWKWYIQERSNLDVLLS